MSPSATPPSRIRSAGFFALRTPLLPFEELDRWWDGLDAPGALGDADALAEAVASDSKRLRSRLAALSARPEVREALFIASPDLCTALDAWRTSPDGTKAARIENSLVRYFARMAARPTPFGLFAGCSVGQIGGETRLELAALSGYRRHARLDMDYLTTLGGTLARDPGLQQDLRYRPNSSLYRTAGRLRYAESTTSGGARAYRLVAVEETPYLAKVLEQARPGATLRALAEGLVDDAIAFEEASAFLQELVEAQVLAPDFAPAATGPEPIHDLLAQLREHPASRGILPPLEMAQRALDTLNGEPLGAEPACYRSIADGLSELPVPVPASLPKLFQVDMVKPAVSMSLSRVVIDELCRAIELLHGLREPSDPFQSFRERFRERYEMQERPLLEVLDEESGIGFERSRGHDTEPAPLLEGLRFPSAETSPPVAWGALDTFLLGRLSEVVAAHGLVLELSPAEIARLKPAVRAPLPEAFCVVAMLGAASPEAVDRGEFTVALGGVGGPSGARMLGRFCHADPALLAHVQSHLREEEAAGPDAVYAEIVHLPEGRVGNVILRPRLRGYEIPYLGRSGAPADRQIAATDLLVSIVGERVVLRSKRLGCEVIPRLSSAHNFSARSLGVYRFLCSLQQQKVASGVGWSWGPIGSAPFLPRVVVGRTVLARAAWHVEEREFRELAVEDEGRRYRAVQAWRAQRRIPRLVTLVDGDNKLLFDLTNVLALRTLVDLVGRRPLFKLEEFYPGPDALCVTGPEGRFVGELVVPFTCRAELADTRALPAPAPPGDGPVARMYAPGSEWLYAKIYAGPAGGDIVLREIVSPLVREMQAAGIIDRWFFVRYGDPEWHVRIRFHGSPSALTGHVLPRLHELFAPFHADHTAHKLQLDTYQRETERYGGEAAIALAERFFHLDSETALAVLELFPGDAGADVRWRLCLLGMQRLLADLDMSTESQLRFAQNARAALLRRFQADTAAFRKRLGERFRQERRQLDDLFDPAAAAGPLGRALAVLDDSSRRFRAEVAPDLLRLVAEGRLVGPLEAVVSSYLHMRVNRFVRAAGPPHELVLYDFLSRLCASWLARARTGGEQTAWSAAAGMEG